MKTIKKIIDEIAETVSKEFHVLGSTIEETAKKMNIKIIKTDRMDDILNGTIRKKGKQLFEILLYPSGISEKKQTSLLQGKLDIF